MAKDSATINSAPARRYLPLLLTTLAGGLLGVGLGAALAPSAATRKVATRSDASPATASPTAVDEVQPNPAWSPAEVVQRQMEALSASRTNAAAIRRCFALASPANRQFTGPVERFAAMVATPTYRPLIDVRSFLVGKPIVKDGYAAVLVSLVTRENQSYAFRFLLSKQSGAESAGCWMTDGVSQVLPPPRRSAPQLLSSGPGV